MTTLEEYQRDVQKMNSLIKGQPTYEQLMWYYSVASYMLEDKVDKDYIFKVTKFVKQWTDRLWQYKDDEDEFYRLHWNTMLLEAPHLFESYIQYMEKDRGDSKKFYEPRKCALKTVVNDLQDLEDDKIKFYGLSMPSRVGKLISDDTPVLTENGWKKHGELQVGDYVYDFDGLLTKVIYVHPKQYANKRVWFSDHTYIDCHENHEWIVFDSSKNREITVETNELVKSPYKENGYIRYKYQIPNTPPLMGCEKDLPIAPYTFGAWLGDGTNKKPRITICDTDFEILEQVVRDGYDNIHAYKQQGCTAFEFANLKADLQKIGLCHSRKKTQKHIPDIYLTSSLSQRLDLLAGLLDTDGTLKINEHRYSFSTSDEILKEDFVSLVSTFGWRCCVTKYDKKTSSSGIVGRKDIYVVSFNPTFEIPCRVKRKKLTEFSKKKRISVTKVEDIKPIQGNCITVMGGLYRVGRRMIPTHNSTICIFFLSWIMGKRPNNHNAMGGHSGLLAKGFYGELLNLIDTEEYNFREIFPELIKNNQIVQGKSADDFTINLGKPDRFNTMTCRGIEGTWIGAIDISPGGYLYIDDLVRDRKHSLSPTRMEETFQEYLNKMVDRMNDGAKQLMVGTLWSVLDPLSRIEQQYGGREEYRFRKIPALDENDESNFQYTYYGFSTKYYHEMREKLDNAEWMAKFMQAPYIREGLLLPLDELRYFNGILPDGDSRVVAVCDVAWGGGDNLSMPIGREYENGDIYIFDWLYSTGTKEETVPQVVGKIIENEIRQERFEGNVGGAMYSAYVDEKLQELNYKCNCTEKKAPNKMSKLEKIMAYSGDIKRKFVFLMPNGMIDRDGKNDSESIKRYRRSNDYQRAMDDVGMFVTVGKNKTDDAVDSLTQLAMFVEGDGVTKVEVFNRGRIGL